MDPYIYAIAIPLGFTFFGYIWGSSKQMNKAQIQAIVGRTMDNLEADGFLKTKVIDGELHYIKWPTDSTHDSNS
jgi:hypothetical protein